MNLTLLFQSQSILVLILLTAGILVRKNRNMHIRWIIPALVIDFLLVIEVELTRGVVQTTTTLPENTLLTNIHIAISVATVLFYLTTIYTGWNLFKGKEKVRPVHRFAGWSSYVLRLLVFITSFQANLPI